MVRLGDRFAMVPTGERALGRRLAVAGEAA